jgi:hypothetical protein
VWGERPAAAATQERCGGIVSSPISHLAHHKLHELHEEVGFSQGEQLQATGAAAQWQWEQRAQQSAAAAAVSSSSSSSSSSSQQQQQQQQSAAGRLV